jgi:exodeoxyribonuclease VII large subunit
VTTRVVSVALLASYIRQLFEADELLADIWIEGEVSELFASRAGHVYFTLRDAESQIKCVLFRNVAIRQKLLPRVGDQVAAHGRVSTYERDGTYQLYVDAVEHAGQGALALQFELMRQRLESEGLFDESRKRPLPPLPRWIGVVTSAEGAVWQDIQTVLRRRYPLAHLLLAATPVQGESAPDGVVEALTRLQQDGRAELIIVARGGGSAEDLAAFNDERIARAVFACRVPVISAIGHETDWTIIDLVADVRAATPSAAAELCAPSRESLASMVADLHGRAFNVVRAASECSRSQVAGYGRLVERHTPALLVKRYRDEIQGGQLVIGAWRRATLDPLQAVVDRDQAKLGAAFSTRFGEKRTESAGRIAVLEALNPRRVIARGYAVLEDAESGRLVASPADTEVGRSLIAHVASGRITARVVSVDSHGGVGHNE